MTPQVLTDGLKFPEGPVWAPDGMCIDEAGTMLICVHNAGVVAVHTADGTPLSQIVMVRWERPGLRLNDHCR